MEKIKIEIEVAKESYELANALAKLVIEIKAALKDGISAADLPAMMALLISKDIVDGISGLEKIPMELKEDKMLVIDAFAIAGTKIASELLK